MPDLAPTLPVTIPEVLLLARLAQSEQLREFFIDMWSRNPALAKGAGMRINELLFSHDTALTAALRAALPGLRAVYRYGSSGGPHERDDSDIDIAVLADAPLDASTRLALAADLSRIAGKDVDLNDLRTLPVTLRVQIVLDGKRLFAADPVAAEYYETHTLSDYVRLNEERRGILDQVRERGSIHG